MVAAIGLAATAVSVFASKSSTHENMKQKNAATPIPAPIVGTKIFTKKEGNEYYGRSYVSTFHVNWFDGENL